MRVSLSLNNACQPLRNLNFGKAEEPQKSSTSTNPAFSAGTVSKAEYDKLNKNYDLACRIICAQEKEFKDMMAKTGYNCTDCKK